MASFSERYGYTKPSDVFIKEEITEPIRNSIINWLCSLRNDNQSTYDIIEFYLWRNYFNYLIDDFEYNQRIVYKQSIIMNYINSDKIEWYKKLDLLEVVLSRFKTLHINNKYIDILNSEFERHNFAYRIIDGKFEEVTSKEEIQSIEEALKTDDNGVKTHLNSALEFLSASNKTPDYRNSIKESISAVETVCRKLTGANDLGKALSELDKKGITIQSTLKKGIEKLYHYTNDPNAGIRHALLEEGYSPTSEDAIFMLVTCSAFINFLKKKNGQ